MRQASAGLIEHCPCDAQACNLAPPLRVEFPRSRISLTDGIPPLRVAPRGWRSPTPGCHTESSRRLHLGCRGAFVLNHVRVQDAVTQSIDLVCWRRCPQFKFKVDIGFSENLDNPTLAGQVVRRWVVRIYRRSQNAA